MVRHRHRDLGLGLLALVVLLAPSTTEARGQRVNRMVKGLYESVPAQHELTVGRLQLKGAPSRYDDSYRLDLTWTDRRGQPTSGFLIRTVKTDPRTGKATLNLGNALLKPQGRPRLPKFIDAPGSVSMVPGRGTPTVVFGTLQILRLHNVPKGGLSSMTSYISNGQTTVEMMLSPKLRMRGGKPTEASMARAFMETQSGRYFKTIAQQSGHRVTGVKVKLEMTEEADVASLGASNQAIGRLLRGYRKERIDLPLFEVELSLAPLRGR